MLSHRRSDFPDGFVFGVAGSAYQLEGHAFGGAGATEWDSFAITPGNVAGAETGDIAVDHYTRWPEDLDLAAQAGFDGWRFSTSWARVLPEGRGTPNQAGLDYYDRLVDGMLQRGLKPALTLYHWELPQPLADMGGWRNADMPSWFAEFADLIARRLGDRLWSAAPINEPWCVAWLSHFEGGHAPGLRDIRAAARSVHHVLLAQAEAIAVFRAAGIDQVGAIVNLEYALSADASLAAATAAARYDAIYNRMFLGPLCNGAYPEFVLEGLEPHLPRGWQTDLDRIRTPVDWIGLNYYTATRVAGGDGPWPSLRTVPGPLPHTAMGWEIRPEGLAHMLAMVPRDFTGSTPIYITENGMAAHDLQIDGRIDDITRIRYLDTHLARVRTAIAAGSPVRGYFVWSLLDNYEWTRGYALRFGLVHVDRETMVRTPKASWHALRQMLAHGRAGELRGT